MTNHRQYYQYSQRKILSLLYFHGSYHKKSTPKGVLFFKENMGLVMSRQCVSDWRYVFCTKYIADFNLTGTAGRFGAGYVCRDTGTDPYDPVAGENDPGFYPRSTEVFGAAVYK